MSRRKLAVDERVEMAMANNSTAASHVFKRTSDYLRSDPSSHYLRVLALTPSTEQCVSYRVSTQILSRRQHAPNKLCALNNDVRLTTRFYGMKFR